MKTGNTLYRSVVRVVLGVAFVLSLPLVAMLITDDVVWSLADFVAAGVLLATIGVALELALVKAGNLAVALGIAAVGVVAATFGEADDAPGLVLLGILLVVSASALGVRTAQRSRRLFFCPRLGLEKADQFADGAVAVRRMAQRQCRVDFVVVAAPVAGLS